MVKKNFIIALILVSISILILFVLYFLSYLSLQSLIPIIMGSSVATINFILAFYSIRKDIINGKLSLGNFLKLLPVRISISLSLIILSILFLDINRNKFIFSTLIFYVFYQIVEVKTLIKGEN